MVIWWSHLELSLSVLSHGYTLPAVGVKVCYEVIQRSVQREPFLQCMRSFLCTSRNLHAHTELCSQGMLSIYSFITLSQNRCSEETKITDNKPKAD